MKSFIATGILLISLAYCALAQSTTTPPPHPQSVESNQDKKEHKAKVRAQKETAKPAADKGKKTTSTQDAAYAAAFKAEIPK